MHPHSEMPDPLDNPELTEIYPTPIDRMLTSGLYPRKALIALTNHMSAAQHLPDPKEEKVLDQTVENARKDQ